ncbi:hypothetical protein M7784_08400 [Desulfovibrio aminophilus]|nr:hypothetical protein [Desulfovibrio aminophilus]MCM0755267.1 hypothetical protein [Desulfovibrio aminophilus]
MHVATPAAERCSAVCRKPSIFIGSGDAATPGRAVRETGYTLCKMKYPVQKLVLGLFCKNGEPFIP